MASPPSMNQEPRTKNAPVYLNEWDDFPAAGLAAMYPHATVDTTSIVLLNRTDYGPHPAGVPVDVDLSQFTQCHFFCSFRWLPKTNETYCRRDPRRPP